MVRILLLLASCVINQAMSLLTVLLFLLGPRVLLVVALPSTRLVALVAPLRLLLALASRLAML